MKCSSKWEAKVKWLIHKHKYSTKPEIDCSFSDPYLYSRFLVKTIRRHPSKDWRFSVVLCIMKGFPSSNVEILFFLVTLPAPRPLLLGDCDHGVTAILDQNWLKLLTVWQQIKIAIFQPDSLSSGYSVFPLACPVPPHFILWNIQLSTLDI